MTIESLSGSSAFRHIPQGKEALSPKGTLGSHSASILGPIDQNMDRTKERQGREQDKCLACCAECTAAGCKLFFDLCCRASRIR